MTLPGHNRRGEMGLRPRVVRARGRPGNICAPCWRALPAPMRLSAPTRGLKCRLKIPRMDVAGLSKGTRLFYFLSQRIFFIILVSSMSSSGCGSIHVFVESYDFTIMYCEHMRKVTPELPTSRFNTPSVMTKSDDFITLSDKLSWIKMLNLLRVNQRFEELPHLFMTSTFASKWHILYFR